MPPPFFDFNIYSALLLVGWANGLLHAVLLLVRWGRERRSSDLFAAAIVCVFCAYAAQWMLGFAGWYDARDWRTVLMFYLPWDHLLALGPLMYFYLRAVTNAGFVWTRSVAGHFLPWAAVVLLYLVAAGYDLVYTAGLLDESLPYFFGTRGPVREHFWLYDPAVVTVLGSLTYLHLSAYLALTVKNYRRYRLYLADGFSDDSGLSLTGLRNLVILIVGGIVLALAVSTYQSIYGEVRYVSEWWHHLVITSLGVLSGIQFYQVSGKRTAVLCYPSEAVSEPEGPTEATAVDKGIWANVSDRMRRHRDFLEADLRLSQLAERVGVQDKVLSAAINRCANQNFNDYVNGLRCEYLVERLQSGDHRQQTLLALALDAGFNSKSTFNRAFRKHYGCSPREVVDRLEAGDNLSQKMI